MSKIKIAEIFHSLQGEGLYVGQPSVFIRTFGCNFQCKGFGLTTSDVNTIKFSEADGIAVIRKIHPEWKYNDLPLVTTGCDSYASWHPKFKDLSPMMEVDDILKEMEIARKQNEPFEHVHEGGTHIVITGGEPLLGWQKSYPELLTKVVDLGYSHITIETNGTQPIGNEFDEFLLSTRCNITFSVSPKLPCSGERIEDALQPEIVASYQQYGLTYLKFVVSNEDDIKYVNSFVKSYKDAGFCGEVFLMPCGGDSEMYNLNAPEVARLAMHEGYRYSPRLQVDLWKNKWGT